MTLKSMNDLFSRTLLRPGPSARYLHTASFLHPGLMIVFGGNTHNDTVHSHGAKCYSGELLSYDVVCDSWQVSNRERR